MIHQEITNENKCGVSDGSKGGAQWARPLLFWMKKEEITDGIKAGRASKTKCPPSVSSRSSFATGCYKRTVCTFIQVWHLLVRCPSKAVHRMPSLLSFRYNPSSKGVHTRIFVRHGPKVFH